MTRHFLNQSQLGSFGEFVYKTYCESLGLHIERTNFCHTDFLVRTNVLDKSCYVDVKSSLSDKKKYQGKRYHEDIVYELVLILVDSIFVVPDNNSPLQSRDRIDLGSLSDWLNRWHENNEIATKRKSRLDDSTLSELQSLFSQTKFSRSRIVERGDASGKRWSGTVDNLPGSDNVVDKYDVTAFFEFGCENFEEKLSKIYLIRHSLLRTNEIKMLKPNSRQSKKGIKEVIDIHAFINDHPNLVFDNLDDFKSYLLTRV